MLFRSRYAYLQWNHAAWPFTESERCTLLSHQALDELNLPQVLRRVSDRKEKQDLQFSGGFQHWIHVLEEGERHFQGGILIA